MASLASAELFHVVHSRVGRDLQCRVSVFGRSVIEIVVEEDDAPAGRDWLIAHGAGRATAGEGTVLLCETTGTFRVHGTGLLIAGRIIAILAPPREIEVGQALDMHEWLSCSRVTPTDPIQVINSLALAA